MGAVLTLWAGHISKGCPMYHVSPTDWKWGDSCSPHSLSIGHHAGHHREPCVSRVWDRADNCCVWYTT